ncbi:hypothetical protein [Streptosporangium sp. NPDC002607]
MPQVEETMNVTAHEHAAVGMVGCVVSVAVQMRSLQSSCRSRTSEGAHISVLLEEISAEFRLADPHTDGGCGMAASDALLRDPKERECEVSEALTDLCDEGRPVELSEAVLSCWDEAQLSKLTAGKCSRQVDPRDVMMRSIGGHILVLADRCVELALASVATVLKTLLATGFDARITTARTFVNRLLDLGGRDLFDHRDTQQRMFVPERDDVASRDGG